MLSWWTTATLDGTWPRMKVCERDRSRWPCERKTAVKQQDVAAVMGKPTSRDLLGSAITIDTERFPPHVLLIRGRASVELVDGVPADYLAASSKLVPPDQYDAWEAGVRSLYEQMVRITVEPDWAKLLDFETTIPSAVEELVRARSTR